MQEFEVNNLWELVFKLKARNHEILCSDDPMRRLIGYADITADEVYYITLTKIKSRRAINLPAGYADSGTNTYEKLINLIRMSDGRKLLADYMSGTKEQADFDGLMNYIRRMEDIKAFA